MKNNFIQEIIVSLILIVLLVLMLNPFSLWMPDTISMMIVASLIIVFSVFATFIWKEKARDEREKRIQEMVGRLSSIVGAFFLIIGITVQSFNHNIDQWLIIALGAMILTKVVGLIYSRIDK